MSFLNLGYLSDAGELDAEDDPKIADRVSERLYAQVVGDVDLAGRTVMEVGCGPGSGSAYLASSCHPASFLGVDLSEDMITWCREHHDVPNLQFLQGDAQNLPIANSSVDAVINVESSHCYPSRQRFFEEVVRVLRPGGSFLFADLMESGQRSDAVNDLLSDAGLVIEDCIDITANVLAAREAVSRSPYFRASLRKGLSPAKVPFAESFIFLTGTNNYAKLASREVEYFQWKASKPSENSTISSAAETAGTAGTVTD